MYVIFVERGRKKNFKVSHSLYGRQEHVTWISGGEYKCPVEFVLDFFSVSFFHSSQWFYSFGRFLYGFFFHLSVYSPSIKDIETLKKRHTHTLNALKSHPNMFWMVCYGLKWKIKSKSPERMQQTQWITKNYKSETMKNTLYITWMHHGNGQGASNEMKHQNCSFECYFNRYSSLFALVFKQRLKMNSTLRSFLFSSLFLSACFDYS